MHLSRRDVLKHAITGSAMTLMPLSLLANSHHTNQQINKTTDNITLIAPKMVKKGQLVPVHVASTMSDIQSISVFVDNNPTPLAAEFKMFEGLKADFKIPVDMACTSKITAVLKTTDGFYTAQTTVQVITNNSMA